MKKRIVAFYDALLFAIICFPMIACAVILLFVLVTKGTSEWIYENWYLVLAFAAHYLAGFFFLITLSMGSLSG